MLNLEMYRMRAEVLEMEEWDLELTGARLLGREAAHLLDGSEAAAAIRTILAAQVEAEFGGPFLRSMGTGCAPIERRFALLAALARGLDDDPHSQPLPGTE